MKVIQEGEYNGSIFHTGQMRYILKSSYELLGVLRDCLLVKKEIDFKITDYQNEIQQLIDLRIIRIDEQNSAIIINDSAKWVLYHGYGEPNYWGL